MTALTLLPTITAADWRWVAAAPFRAHLRNLQSETELPWRALAGHAGVPDRVVRSLLLGRGGRPVRRIAPHYARRLLRLHPGELQLRLKDLVPSDTARHCAHLLLGDGWSPTDLAAVAELTRPEMDTLLLGHATRVPLRVATRVPLRVQILLAAAARAHRLEPSGTAEYPVEDARVAA